MIGNVTHGLTSFCAIDKNLKNKLFSKNLTFLNINEKIKYLKSFISHFTNNSEIIKMVSKTIVNTK